MKKDDLRKLLYESGEQLEIPKSLQPERVQETLEEYDRKQFFRRGKLYPALATAACFCILGAGLLNMHRMGLLFPAGEKTSQEEELSGETDNAKEPQKQDVAEAIADWESEDAQVEELELPRLTYEEIYEKLSANWVVVEAVEESLRNDVIFEASADEVPTASGAVSDLTEEFAKMESEAFGKTNVQVKEIDEADRIKNDGRYLYQIASKKMEESEDTNGAGAKRSCGIQIVDTKDGLNETAFVTGFDSVEEFYVWEDLLITIENKYYEATGVVPLAESSRMQACYDVLYHANQYHEITVFDIADRSRPKEIKTFTLQGNYESSRIADGYFYGISRFMASPGEGETDYDAYIPSVDGQVLSASQIYCPEYEAGNQYLVIVSVDLQEPTKLKDSRAVLSDSGIYYMSQRNLYLTSYESVWTMQPEEEGSFMDKTQILRFTYLNGMIYAQAEGEVPGNLESSFSMDEYNGNLRVVSTVQEHETTKVVDDRTGEVLGYDILSPIQTNALYVLDRNLAVIGKIEGLAKEEQIYSARFFGDTGYFVTFRQTDPLFAVDLSDPQNPKVLAELKVSGFSEYLHFWGEDLLLGIGMETDEETGRTEGLKLSMFDISDPTHLLETSRKELTAYDYSEALYDHKAVLIDVGENLIGFCAEGSDSGVYRRDYVVYSYESGDFVQKMKFSAKSEDGGFYNTRGTFIGDTFYVLSEDGSVKAYDRLTGNLLEKI